MIVLDGSALVDHLLGQRPQSGWVAEQLLASGWNVHAPHCLDLEVCGVIRREVVAGLVAAERGALLVQTLGELRITRHGHVPLLRRMWQLYPQVTVADAFYVALAEALRAPLVTTDARLGRAHGIHADVRVFPG